MGKNYFNKTALTAVFMSIIFMYEVNIVSAQNSVSELPDSLVKERIDYIQKMLDGRKTNANRWWYGWLIGYSAVTVGQGANFFISDSKKTKQDMTLGAAVTFLGAAGQIIDPMTPGSAPATLRSIPENTPQERRKKLLEGERLLQKCAQREKDGRSFRTQLIVGAVNLTSGLIVWLGFKRSIWEGLGNFALGTAVTEIQIFTQPTKAINDYANYDRKYRTDPKPSLRKRQKSFFVSLCPNGLRIGVIF